jgi:hypothetical protein
VKADAWPRPERATASQENKNKRPDDFFIRAFVFRSGIRPVSDRLIIQQKR